MTGASAWSVALVGMEGAMVEVEAATGGGLPRTVLVGLPDTALYEARDRCRASVAAAGLGWPSQLLTINLTPASLPKAGTHFDLAIAAATLASVGVVHRTLLGSTVLMGELGLDSRVRAVRGVLPALLAARSAGFERAVVPASQYREAALVKGLTIWPVTGLKDLVAVLNGCPLLMPPAQSEHPTEEIEDGGGDLDEVIGQQEARFALEVAAAGRHHLLLRGAPGCGKSMIAARLPTILPALIEQEALEVTALHSLAGTNPAGGLITRPPLSAPHHNVSMAAMVGGGPRIARPGAISLAHRGVLFLDEAPEFPPRVLDALRGPLETGTVTIGRSQAQTRYPARFQLVTALNPCPCGMADDPSGRCTCTPQAVMRYAARLSGPILDRVDVHQRMRPLTSAALLGSRIMPAAESSSTVAARVADARQRAAARLAETPWRTNADIPGSYLRRSLPAPSDAEVLEEALARGRLSARGVDKVLRIAWTLADLAGTDRIGASQLRAAMALRRAET
ncbi:ATP-binding protein [Acidipropionibacterium jensenii]|nr:ATP-binding protein [Acidipropionibacterium jensenii]